MSATIAYVSEQSIYEHVSWIEQFNTNKYHDSKFGTKFFLSMHMLALNECFCHVWFFYYIIYIFTLWICMNGKEANESDENIKNAEREKALEKA